MAKPESFYQKLTRIFRSAPAIQRRVKGYDYRSFYNTQTQQGALGFRPPSPMGFGRENSPFSSMGESGLLDRMSRYSDFASMEYSGEIASALDVYSHEVVGGDDRGKSFHVFSKNPEIKKALDELFYDVMNVEFNLGPWVRNLCKFGDFFLFNEVIPDIGIINVAPIPVSELEREEGFDREDPFAVRYKWLTRGNQYLENWQVTHMRILGNDAFLPYGHSVLESSRRIWRTLQMMEDAMLVYRVIRAPDRRVFYIDIGNIDPKDVPSYMEAAKAALRSSTMTEHAHGRGDQRHNPLPVHKDTPIPLLDGRTLSIEQLAKEFDEGKTNWVYSVQDKTLETVPGKVIWCGKNYTATKLVKVWLDDNTYVITAPEHPFVLRDGSSLRADELTSGLSLMPLYREISTSKMLTGYERVWCNAKQKYIHTHRIVGNSVLHEEREVLLSDKDYMCENKYLVVHHKDFIKTNNDPKNLKWLGNKVHTKLHGDTARKNIIKYNKSESKKKRTSELNVEKNSVAAMSWYNTSDLHKSHNDIRRKVKTQKWSTNKETYSKSMRWVIPDEFFDHLEVLVKENPKFGPRKIHELVVSNKKILSLLAEVNKENNRDVAKFSNFAWESELERRGYKKLTGYRESIMQGFRNHKVRNIEHLEVPGEDVYCMTVVGPSGENDRHNFSATSFSEDGIMSKSAIFLKNSIDEDYFIAVRGTESGTKIDTLSGGTNATAIEDVEFMQKKLFAALKVPKPYLNYDEQTGAKATLAQEDIRFSRTITNLQKIVIAELNKLAMIHLYSKGFDGEDLINFELKLSNPSTIALQQRLEIWQTKADIAGTIKEIGLVDETWIKKNILELTDEDIVLGNQRRIEDKIREVELEAIEAKERIEQQAKTIDEFDPANYTLTGEDVPKLPASDDENLSIVTGSESAEELLNKIKSYDEDGDPYFVDYDPKQSPLKASPQSTWADKKYNRKRRVGTTGRDNLANPDFTGMLSTKNRSLKDLYDKRFLDNPFNEEITIHTNKLPNITGEMKSIFNKLQPLLSKNDKISKILSEEISSEDSTDSGDSKFLLENIHVVDMNEPENKNEDIETDFDEILSKDSFEQ